MNYLAKEFLTSIRAQLLNSVSMTEFVVNETYLNGKKFSFSGHEYQEYIANILENNPGCELVCLKPSQLGLSELFYRLFLAKMKIRPGTSVLLSFPSKQMSSEIFKTRWDPIIEESPSLRNSLNNDVNSASVKQFLNNSIAYALSGSPNSKSNLISRPISDIMIDEIDRQDPDIVNSFGSRTTHTPAKDRLTVKVSTPTVDGLGISAEMAECRTVHTPYVKCEHCGNLFDPDFFKDVVIPGYDEPMRALTKVKASYYDLGSAFLRCPECRKEVAKQDYVWEVTTNDKGVENKIGVNLTPFVAPGFITMPDLVRAFLTFTNQVEFLNQKLAKVADSKDSSINISNIHYECSDNKAGQYICGLDMGKTCHLTVGVLRHDTTVHVVKTLAVPLADLDDTLTRLNAEHVFSCIVMDSMPYFDVCLRLLAKYDVLYTAVYISPMPQIPEMYKIKMHDKDGNIVRQVTINKSPMMDLFAGSLNDFFTFEPSPMQATVIKHMLDMRRVRDYRYEEMVYCWVKSKQGEDHFFHSLFYLFVASKLVLANQAVRTAVPFVVKKIRVE